MSPKPQPNGGWPTPRQLGAQLTVMALVGAALLWAGSLLYVKRSDYDTDRYTSSITLTSMAKDLEYIKQALQRLEVRRQTR